MRKRRNSLRDFFLDCDGVSKSGLAYYFDSLIYGFDAETGFFEIPMKKSLWL